MFLQTLHLVLNVSHVLEALLLRNLQLVFNPALGLMVSTSKINCDFSTLNSNDENSFQKLRKDNTSE